MKAIYPGTFDPITNGHLDIIKRSLKIFDTLIIAVAYSSDKNPMFSLQDRVEMIKLSIEDYKNIQVEPFSNLLVDFALEKDSMIFIRGLRAVSDFEYEFQMGYANSSLNQNIETIYLMPSLKNTFISSSVVRSILKHNGRISHLVPNGVVSFLEDKEK
ncbi:pantetheine-phosphate adenylyltransferase [Helicobacter sp. MIT 14-3879]|uniref:pantetheine-phosphate adenylyltransferase n=1 Tax=Helicobacter sp. MIT 14-3879 TaxID=2040649 RepID=UPI000E1F2138|nr:pantetheine-phosphate adenylyltransferase [Helicobacter sp. MIT 14-3879]RDU62877.1 pantetheine-phosphate adenylyltransferase [Helicobacter sp. MIT 14-3879]